MKLSVVTTLYGSARHLAEFHARVTAAVGRVTSDYEILLINDGSPDDSQEIALKLCEDDPHVGLVELSRNFGHHKAMMTGLAHARGDLVMLIDCDLEEPPELFESFHKTLISHDADVVYGVQQERRGGLWSRFAGRLYYRLFNFLSSHAIPENVLTARLMTRAYVRSLVRHRERELCISGLWVITGFRQVAIPVSKLSLSPTTYSLSRKLAIMVNHLTAFSNRPLIYVFYLGCLILLLSSLTGAYLVVHRLLFGMLEGWASLMVSIWFLGGLMIFCMGVIGIYLAKMFSEVKQRPYTIIRGRYGLIAKRRRRLGRARRAAAAPDFGNGNPVTTHDGHSFPEF